jgi:hypothetical protein
MLGTYVDRKTTPEEFDICFRDTYIKRAEEDASVKETLDGLQRKCCWLPLVSDEAQKEDRRSGRSFVSTFLLAARMAFFRVLLVAAITYLYLQPILLGKFLDVAVDVINGIADAVFDRL